MQLAEKVMSNAAARAFNAPWTEVDTHELGRPHLRFRNPIVSGGLEGLRQAQYDIVRVDVATAFPTITLFAIPVGGQYTQGVAVAFQKTLLHTSMKQYAVLQSPNKQLVRAIKIELTGEPTAGGHRASSIHWMPSRFSMEPLSISKSTTRIISSGRLRSSQPAAVCSMAARPPRWRPRRLTAS